ncbi:MAG: tetratricopeptide repeat protein [Deferribacteres bacterium]|nr:tetratricopeptide repeat protein [candidate division KSB1 bacterium]MCB9511350.1 tetratricopeptide repeat protein [Deferribacteres bacterium]
MESKKSLSLLQQFVCFSALLVFATVAYWGCSSTPKMTPEQMAEMEAREKAKQDSIANFELRKNWSFGYTNYQNKEYERVTGYFWKVIELDKNNTFKDVYTFLGDTYMQQQKGDSAEIVYKKGIEIYPDNAFLHRQLGFIYENTQRIPEAIAEYEKVVSLEPESIQDVERLTGLYVKANDIDKAIESYQSLMKLAPDNKAYQEDYAALLASTGRESEAIDQKMELLQANPNDTKLLLDLAMYYKKERNWDEASTYYERYLAIQDDAFAIEDLADIYQNNGEFRKAIGVYDRILAKKPNDVKAIAGQAESYRELGDLQRALQLAQKASRIDSKYGRAYLVAGQVYEAAVEKCKSQAGRKNYNFDDKLVFEMANNQWKLAARDPEVRNRAESLMRSIAEVLPKSSDRFMNQGQTQPKSSCYSWLK